MPIIQPRMISLINAAQDFRQAFEEACRLVRQARNDVLDNHQSPAEALQFLCNEISRSARLRDPDDSGAIISEEVRYYRLNLKRNERARIKQHKRRHPDGSLPPARVTTAPRSIANPGFIQSPYDTDGSVRHDIDLEVQQALQSRARQAQLDPETKAEIEREAAEATSRHAPAPMTQADVDRINAKTLAELNKPKEAFGIEDLLDPEDTPFSA